MKYWTYIKYKQFECARWKTFQHHKFCFHSAHDGIKNVTWDACGCARLHSDFALLVMHPLKEEPLPDIMDPSSFAPKAKPAPPVQVARSVPRHGEFRKDSFPIYKEIRSKYFSRERQIFAARGYHSLQIPFSEDQEKHLRSFLKDIFKRSRSYESKYYTGRLGYPITKIKLKTLELSMLRTIFNQNLLDSVRFYFANHSDLLIYDVEVLRTPPRSNVQTQHPDISVEGAGFSDPRFEVSDIRLVVVCIISFDGAVTTEVSPNTRTEQDMSHTRPFVRATQDCNCVMFDSRLSHRGAAHESDHDLFRLVVTFINANASREQVEVVNACLQKSSWNMSVSRLLADRGELAMKKKSMLPNRKRAAEESTHRLRSHHALTHAAQPSEDNPLATLAAAAATAARVDAAQAATAAPDDDDVFAAPADVNAISAAAGAAAAAAAAPPQLPLNT